MRGTIRSAATAAFATAALLAAVVPAFRHRHAGDAAHTHGRSHAHSHGHAHPHSHGHSHHHGSAVAAGREGWHVHLSLFGFELTLWEPGSDTGPAENAEASRRHQPTGRAVSRDVASAWTAPAGVSWMSLFWIEPGPLPERVRRPGAAGSSAAWVAADAVAAGDAAPPAVPPPEAA